MADVYLRPEDVSPQDARNVLAFLNAAQSAQEIADAVEIPEERDVGVIVAQHILDRRQKLGGFTNLQEVADVRQVGPERFTEIVTTLRGIPASSEIVTTLRGIPASSLMSNPVGGGFGYKRIVDNTRGDVTIVSNDPFGQALRDTLTNATAGDVVYVDDNEEIDLSRDKTPIEIHEGVTLASGRGRDDSLGALIYTTETTEHLTMLEVVGSGVRVTGLRLRGPEPSVGDKKDKNFPRSVAIHCSSANLEVENCELSGWTHAGVFLQRATNSRIHHNYFHHNQHWDLGYGVLLDEADAFNDANVFDWCRHAIAGTGSPGTSYEARYNVFFENFYHYPLDMHKDRRNGIRYAGDRISIHHNTIYTAKQGTLTQTYISRQYGLINIEGEPRERSYIFNNRFEVERLEKTILSNTYPAISQTYYVDNKSTAPYEIDEIRGENFDNIEVSGNNYKPQYTASSALVARTANGELLLYKFPFYVHGSLKVGHGFNFTHYLVGNWTGGGSDDLVVRNANGDLLLYKFPFYVGSLKVGHGFNFTHYLVGNWTGGGKDLIVRNSSGELYLYRYPFYDHEAVKVGSGFNFTHYLVGKWTGSDTDDLICRTAGGDVFLYPFDGGTFYGQGGPIDIGSGWDFTHYFVGKWTGSDTDDLVVRTAGGAMFLYPFDGGTFYGQGGPIDIGSGWDFTHYFVGKWTGSDTDDLVVRTAGGDLFLYPFDGGTFYGTWGGQVGHAWHFADYLVGKWQ